MSAVLTPDTVKENKTKESYRVVFWGECAAGYNKKDVMLAFAKQFNIKSRRQLAQIFSGRLIPLKSGLNLTQAHRYITAIQDIGGVCRFEDEYRDFFGEEEVKERNSVSFLHKDFDPETLTLKPKE